MECTTYGSEFVAAKQATEIRDLQETLKLMGVPIQKSAWMLGDNSSVITSSTIPSSMLKKQHQSLSYHYVRCNVAHGLIKFCKIASKWNIADILTKCFPHNESWHLIQPYSSGVGIQRIAPEPHIKGGEYQPKIYV